MWSTSLMKTSDNSIQSRGGRKTARTATLLFLATLMLSSFTFIAPAANAVSYYPYTIQVGGSTLVQPLAQIWATAFNSVSSGAVSVNYAGVGSTTGIANLESHIYEYAGSDVALTNAQEVALSPKGGIVQFPDALAGAAIIYNVAVTPSSAVLHFNGTVLAAIFLGQIANWQNANITQLNPGVTFPNEAITPTWRTGGSGTTNAFTSFLNKTSGPTGDWQVAYSDGLISTHGCPCYGTTWPIQSVGQGESGSAGVTAGVEGTAGAIGYVDTYYGLNAGLKEAYIKNSAGNYEQPSVATISAAAAADSGIIAHDLTYEITDAPGSTSYPISTYTYALIWGNQTASTCPGATECFQQGYDTVLFLVYAITTGQNFGPGLYYAPLPQAVVTADEARIATINYLGTPFLTFTTNSVSCATSPVTVGKPTICTSTIGAGAPKGTISWSSSSVGTFKATTKVPASGSSRNVYHPTIANTPVTITADYYSSAGTVAGIGTFSLSVSQVTARTVVTCSAIKCSVRVIGYQPTGTVTFSQAGTGVVSFSNSGQCTLVRGSCYVSVSAVSPGSDTIQGTYSGDVNNAAGTPGSRTVNVR